MPKFQHFITTTFNVPAANWKKTRAGKTALSEEWFNDRIKIFDNYCLPSYINQTNHNFDWLVFFDVNTPDFYKQRIQEIQQQFPNFKAFFVKDIEDKKLCLIDEVRNNLNPDTEYIITSDIDNDDILHKDYVKNIQEKFQPIDNLVIDLRYGLQLTKTSENEAFIAKYYSVANPFVSLVEKAIHFKTVASYFHNKLRDFQHITVYDEKPMFIQLIHQYNMLNNTSDNKRLTEIDFKDYGIAPQNQFKISAMEAKIYNLKRMFRLILKRFKK